MSGSLPPEPDGVLLHDRRYDVRSYHRADGRMLLRGIIHDEKPPGFVAPEDPDPLSIHQMVVDLVVDYPSLVIVEANVVMEITPHRTCSSIEPAYGKLVGVPIARGFSRTVRELFGGPRGCTHVGALLQAMAPVAIQSMYSMRAMVGTPVALDPEQAREQEREALRFNVDTCHEWAADGDLMTRLDRGEDVDPPVWATERLRRWGRSADEWYTRNG